MNPYPLSPICLLFFTARDQGDEQPEATATAAPAPSPSFRWGLPRALHPVTEGLVCALMNGEVIDGPPDLADDTADEFEAVTWTVGAWTLRLDVDWAVGEIRVELVDQRHPFTTPLGARWTGLNEVPGQKTAVVTTVRRMFAAAAVAQDEARADLYRLSPRLRSGHAG